MSQYKQNTIIASGMKKVTAASGDYLVCMFSRPHNSVQLIYEVGDIPINVHR